MDERSHKAASVQHPANNAHNSALPATQATRPNPEPPTTTTSSKPKVQQPKPQALPSRSGPNSILVSPRQKGNPILNGVRNVAWEYSDIPADYVLGATTCALFLSLKYHRLHPEYIYNRIRDLRGQYNLRVLLTMVDIENHEESLRELSKTSLINNVTVILCWSAQEAGRYLELFKTFENVAPTSIRAQQSSSYSDKLVEFITVPRSINKTDAVGLVSNFGSVRTAVNAGPEELGLVAGWGEKKVQRWCNSVREPFRIKRAAKRTLNRDDRSAQVSARTITAEAGVGPTSQLAIGDLVPLDAAMDQPGPSTAGEADADRRSDRRPAECIAAGISALVSSTDKGALQELEGGPSKESSSPMKALRAEKRKAEDEDMDDGVMAALNKLRQQ